MRQITREVEETIRRCRHTFVIDGGFGVVPYLETICAEVTSLLPFYERGKERMPTYRRMAAEVINAAIIGRRRFVLLPMGIHWSIAIQQS